MIDESEFKAAPIKPNITIDAVAALDIRVGRIVEVSEVEKSNKLVRLRVSFGDHERNILSGMKDERGDQIGEIVGKQALFVVNLEPRKMAGEYSEGMVFDLGYEDDILPALATPEREVPDGTRAG